MLITLLSIMSDSSLEQKKHSSCEHLVVAFSRKIDGLICQTIDGKWKPVTYCKETMAIDIITSSYIQDHSGRYGRCVSGALYHVSVINILSYYPNLKRLRIGDPGIYDDVLQELSKLPDSCVNLIDLEINYLRKKSKLKDDYMEMEYDDPFTDQTKQISVTGSKRLLMRIESLKTGYSLLTDLSPINRSHKLEVLNIMFSELRTVEELFLPSLKILIIDENHLELKFDRGALPMLKFLFVVITNNNIQLTDEAINNSDLWASIIQGPVREKRPRLVIDRNFDRKNAVHTKWYEECYKLPSMLADFHSADEIKRKDDLC
jgi:hypothetical protein